MNRYLVLACLLLATTACSKKDSGSLMPINSEATIVSLINKTWKLSQYIIITNKLEYVFTGSEIAGHALNRLEFSITGIYSSSGGSWSGAYSFFDDSTKIFMKPTDPALVDLTLNIDHLSPQIMILSSHVVNCKQPSSLTEFENFVAIHSKMWLYIRGIDISDMNSVKVKFIYSSR